MKKAEQSAQVIAFPGSAPTEAPTTDHPMWKKAYHAFNNAKQRCTNPKNPSYPTYGGMGIQFLLESPQQMIAEIGLPKPDQSLDRKNPHGNYEHGNIRWTNIAVQAANKKDSEGGSFLSDAFLIKQAENSKQRRRDRLDNTSNFMLMLNAIARGSFTSADLKRAHVQCFPTEALDAGWELGQVPDLAESPSFFHLPSLTKVGEIVRLVGGPLGESKPTVTRAYGVLPSFGAVPPVEALTSFVRSAFPANFIETPGDGYVLINSPSPAFLAQGGMEGAMLYFASWLSCRGTTAAFLPVLELLKRIDSIDTKYKWSKTDDPILDARYLFVPDLQIKAGGTDQLTKAEWSKLLSLVNYRVEYGRKSYLSVSSLTSLPNFVTTALLRDLDVHKISVGGKTSWPEAYATGPQVGNVIGFARFRSALGSAKSEFDLVF